MSVTSGLLPPSYCRSATFQNKTGTAVKLIIYFESGETDELSRLTNGSSVTVERSINHGTWDAVDPIKRVEVTGLGQTYTFDVITQGVEVLTFVIANKDGKLVCEKQ